MIRYRTNVERRVLYGKATVVMMQNLSLLTERGYDKLRCHQWRQSCNHDNFQFSVNGESLPDSKVHGANMGPIWVLSAPDGPHVGPMNLAIRAVFFLPWFCRPQYAGVSEDLLGSYNWWLSTLPSTLCNTSMGTTALAMVYSKRNVRDCYTVKMLMMLAGASHQCWVFSARFRLSHQNPANEKQCVSFDIQKWATLNYSEIIMHTIRASCCQWSNLKEEGEHIWYNWKYGLAKAQKQKNTQHTVCVVRIDEI